MKRLADRTGPPSCAVEVRPPTSAGRTGGRADAPDHRVESALPAARCAWPWPSSCSSSGSQQLSRMGRCGRRCWTSGPPAWRCRPRRWDSPPEEVENLITNPMEQEFFNGIPWLDEIRSDSAPGLSSDRHDIRAGHRPDPAPGRWCRSGLPWCRALPARVEAPAVIQPTVHDRPADDDRPLVEGPFAHRDVGAGPLEDPPAADGGSRCGQRAVWGLRDGSCRFWSTRRGSGSTGSTARRGHRAPPANAMWSSPLTFVEASTPGTGGFIDTAEPADGASSTSCRSARAQDLSQVAVDSAEAASGCAWVTSPPWSRTTSC